MKTVFCNKINILQNYTVFRGEFPFQWNGMERHNLYYFPSNGMEWKGIIYIISLPMERNGKA
jgi:hypothetical protein